ncbi:hypothetical protein PT2222_270135 [Paraburkholderia tropica]
MGAGQGDVRHLAYARGRCRARAARHARRRFADPLTRLISYAIHANQTIRKIRTHRAPPLSALVARRGAPAHRLVKQNRLADAAIVIGVAGRQFIRAILDRDGLRECRDALRALPKVILREREIAARAVPLDPVHERLALADQRTQRRARARVILLRIQRTRRLQTRCARRIAARLGRLAVFALEVRAHAAERAARVRIAGIEFQLAVRARHADPAGGLAIGRDAGAAHDLAVDLAFVAIPAQRLDAEAAVLHAQRAVAAAALDEDVVACFDGRRGLHRRRAEHRTQSRDACSNARRDVRRVLYASNPRMPPCESRHRPSPSFEPEISRRCAASTPRAGRSEIIP